MPKVVITPNQAYNPTGVRLLLAECGVGPMLQDETTITCQMTEAQIDRFRNSRGAAHKLEVVLEAPPVPPVEAGPYSDDEPAPSDPSMDVGFPHTYGKLGKARLMVYGQEEEDKARKLGYIRVHPDPAGA